MYVTGRRLRGRLATVIVRITRPDGSVITGDGRFTPGSDVVFTGEDGSLYYEYILNGIDGTYTVDVLGAGDIVLASTTFTDGVVGGSIGWEKRAHSDGDLEFGATFTVGGANGPFACVGDTENPVVIEDDGPRDSENTDGRIVFQNSVPARTR